MSSNKGIRRSAFKRTLWPARAWVKLAVVISAATAFFLFTGVASVLVEDLINEFLPEGSYSRWVVLLAGVVILALATLLLYHFRDRVFTRPATLYHIAALWPGMSDWYESVAEDRCRHHGYTEMRMIRRTVTGAQGDPDDVSKFISEMIRDVDTQINNDSISTGYDFAPNCVAPVAVGLGYSLLFPRSSRMLEMVRSTESSRDDSRKTAESRRRGKPSELSQVDDMDWALRPGGVDAAGRKRLGVAHMQPGAPGRYYLCEKLGSVVEAHEGHQLGMVDCQHDVKTVLISAQLTTPADSLSKFSVEEFRPDVSLNVRQQASMEGGTDAPEAVQMDTDGKSTLLHPWHASTDLAFVVCWAMHHYPRATIVLALRVPKTVSVALGCLLSNEMYMAGRSFGHDPDSHEPCDGGHCRNRMQRLIVLNYRRGWHPLRIHPAQMSISDQRELMDGIRRAPSSGEEVPHEVDVRAQELSREE